MSANFVGNTLTRSEGIEIYIPHDVTSARPQTRTIAFFANFGRICATEQSLNSKIMSQCNKDVNFLNKKGGKKIHFIGTLNNQRTAVQKENEKLTGKVLRPVKFLSAN